ncbi:MAG: hypothetical protein WDN02_15160 [Methylovirgula sp.]|uniref:hypothetical protein n=1 Tax=Methylovirgula sp. TaxID=1978224 RepID=UPI0030761B24
MNRERLMELMLSAEERTQGYLRAWVKREPKLGQALRNKKRPLKSQDAKQEARCA